MPTLQGYDARLGVCGTPTQIVDSDLAPGDVVTAGGGVKGGPFHSATDELGYQSVENKVHVQKPDGKILHLLGFDHEHLTSATSAGTTG
jgi:hypothetical protein